MADTLHDTLTTFYRAFSGDHALLDRVVTPEWQDIPAAPGQQPGPEGGAQVISMMNAALDDLHITIHDVVDGRGPDGSGLVAVRAELTGVHTGELMGAVPTGRPVAFAIHEFHEVVDGVIRRTWHLEDWLGFFRQVGFPDV